MGNIRRSVPRRILGCGFAVVLLAPRLVIGIAVVLIEWLTALGTVLVASDLIRLARFTARQWSRADIPAVAVAP